MMDLYHKLKFFQENDYFLSVKKENRNIARISYLVGNGYLSIYALNNPFSKEVKKIFNLNPPLWNAVINDIQLEYTSIYYNEKNITWIKMDIHFLNLDSFMNPLGFSFKINNQNLFNSVFEFKIPLKEKINLL